MKAKKLTALFTSYLLFFGTILFNGSALVSAEEISTDTKNDAQTTVYNDVESNDLWRGNGTRNFNFIFCNSTKT